MQFDLRLAKRDDARLLAEMNQQLIEDEGSRNNMSLDELTTRMERWLDDGRQAVIVYREDEVVGYMLYYQHAEEYFPYSDSIYVRQFFIARRYRRRGIGQEAFERIAAEFFPDDRSIMLDVLENNPEAKAFWLKLGFDVYNVTLRRATPTD